VVFVAELAAGEPRADGGEGSDVCFFPLEALPDGLSPPSGRYIRRFAAER